MEVLKTIVTAAEAMRSIMVLKIKIENIVKEKFKGFSLFVPDLKKSFSIIIDFMNRKVNKAEWETAHDILNYAVASIRNNNLKSIEELEKRVTYFRNLLKKYEYFSNYYEVRRQMIDLKMDIYKMKSHLNNLIYNP